MKTFFLFLSITFTYLTTNLFAGDPDILFKKNVEYVIYPSKNKNDEYRLKSKTSVEYTLLSEDAVKNLSVLRFSEPFFAPIRDITPKLNHSKIWRNILYSKFEESKDVFISDYKIHYLNYGNEIKKMDILSYTYEQEYTNINYLPLVYVPNFNKLDEFKVSFEHPTDLTIEFEFFFPADSVSYEKTVTVMKDGTTVTTLFFNNIEFRRQLTNFDYNDIHAVGLVKIKSGNRFVNAIEPTDFLKWYQTNLNFTPKIDSPLPKEIKSILDSSITNLNKVSALHNYVRKNIRYIADMKNAHSFIPHTPDYVLKNGFGDCKDKAFLILSLAHQVGIKVNLVLLSTDRNIPINGAHVSNYDHVICSYDENGKTYYFDPTSEYTEFGSLPSNDISSYAFVMDTLNPKITYIPKYDQKPNIEIEISANVDSLNKAKARIRLNNDYFSQAERANKEMRDVDIENFLNSIINSNFYKISLDYYKLISTTENSVTYEAETDLSNFLIESKNKLYLPKYPFSIYEKKILDRESDRFELNFDRPHSIDFVLNLKTNNLTIEESRSDESVPGIGILQSMLKNVDSKTIKMSAQFTQEQKTILPEQKNNFIGFVKNNLKGKTQMYIFSRGAK